MRAVASRDGARARASTTELAGVLAYDDGASARVASGFDTQEILRYRVEAANGWIEAGEAFNPPSGEVDLEYRIDGRHGAERGRPVDL